MSAAQPLPPVPYQAPISGNNSIVTPVWSAWFRQFAAQVAAFASGTGTVTKVSVVSANGMAGAVASPTSTPAITLSTTVTGIVKGDGTAFSTAVAGTDYQAALGFTPVSNTTTVNGHALSSNVTIAPTDLACTTNDFLIGVGSVATPQTPTQATALLNPFTSILQGLAPASGGGTTNFLRADGEWATPSGGGGGGAPVVQIKSSNYGALITDNELLATATLTFTIPDVTGLATNWSWFVMNDTNNGSVTTIALSGSNVFSASAGGGTSFQLTDPGAWVKITGITSSNTVRVYQ